MEQRSRFGAGEIACLVMIVLALAYFGGHVIAALIN